MSHYRILECYDDLGKYYKPQKKGRLWGWNDLRRYTLDGSSEVPRIEVFHNAVNFVEKRVITDGRGQVVWEKNLEAL